MTKQTKTRLRTAISSFLVLLCLSAIGVGRPQIIPRGKVLIINGTGQKVVFYLRMGSSNDWVRKELVAEGDPSGKSQDLFPQAREISILTADGGRVTRPLADTQRYRIVVTATGQLDVRMLRPIRLIPR